MEVLNVCFKKWKVLGNWQAKWQLKMKSDNDSQNLN